MTHRFTRTDGALLIVDIQERLGAAMAPERLERVINRARAAILGAKALGLPIVLTEQYPRGLGPTMAAVKELLPEVVPVEKLEFSALVPPVRQALSARRSVLVVGMEAHVCVFQTVRALSEAGLTPYLAVDAVLSRHHLDFETGLGLCREAGAKMTTVEAALFDALGAAGGPEFKAISAAVR